MAQEPALIVSSILIGNSPPSLYTECLDCYVAKLNYNVSTLDTVQQLRYLPPGVLIDVYVKMSTKDLLKDMLLAQLSDLSIFERLLRFDPARQKLFRCLTVLANSGRALAAQLQSNFLMRYYEEEARATARFAANQLPKSLARIKLNDDSTATGAESDTATAEADGAGNAATTAQAAEEIVELADEPDAEFSFNNKAVDFGMRLGSFFSEAGWLTESIAVLKFVAAKLRRTKTMETQPQVMRLDCLQRLLHSEAALCSFKSAERTFNEIVELLKNMVIENIPKSLLANTYTQFSAMYFARSEYDASHNWSVVAMRNLEESTPERIAVDVLRQAAKACVVKRDFQLANMLICQASQRARKVFGSKHQKYADTLLDYGFFLLNVDSVYQSVIVYKDALEIKRYIFGNRNFHVAIAHEDLSYAYYVHEYSTGNFKNAREHVENAVDIMTDLVPSDHLMLASAKRVKALLLEEIALDKMAEGVDEAGLLKQSEELHKFALQLSLEVFGEVNVQTAKHYGNLGRLYQTMSRFAEAERMHQKAIKIKTDLLGPYDYEVGLSIGHLASLYNYQMNKFREAEELYLRSIEISLRLFGRSYSGLEYDYLGLCHVYETLREFEKYLKYATILENWQLLRLQNNTLHRSFYPAINDYCALEDVKNMFFEMCN